MDGSYKEGWYSHPSLGLIKVYVSGQSWVFQCYTESGQKALSRERPLDGWTWALSSPADIEGGV